MTSFFYVQDSHDETQEIQVANQRRDATSDKDCTILSAELTSSVEVSSAFRSIDYDLGQQNEGNEHTCATEQTTQAYDNLSEHVTKPTMRINDHQNFQDSTVPSERGMQSTNETVQSKMNSAEATCAHHATGEVGTNPLATPMGSVELQSATESEYIAKSSTQCHSTNIGSPQESVFTQQGMNDHVVVHDSKTSQATTGKTNALVQAQVFSESSQQGNPQDIGILVIVIKGDI